LSYARAALTVGLVLPLAIPWGFVRTGIELWRIAQTIPPTAPFLGVYLQVLIGCRFLLLAYAIASIGRLLIAWGALRMR
jgi:hypothetical protein